MASSTPGDGEMPPPKRRRTESFVSSQASPPREVGLMRKETGRGASFVGSASGIHFVRSVYRAVGPGTPEEDRTSQRDLVPGEEDQLPTEASNRGREQLWRPGETVPPSDGRRVAFEDLVRWSQGYFNHWQPVLPFLHGPSFLALCETISQRPLEEMAKHLNPHQLVIVRSVLSTSLVDRRQVESSKAIPPVPQPLVFESFHDAVTSVQAALTAAPSMLSLQAAVSVQLFLISMLRHNAASRVGGIIIRLVFQMGMHRCPHRFPAFSRQDCVLRQRIFWSVYCLDRYICQSLGIPLTLRDDDVDVCLLDNEQHLTDDETGHGEGSYPARSLSADRAPAMDPRLMLLCLCAKHSTIKGRVLELCNKSINHRNLDMAEVSRVRTMIAKWANDVDSTLDHGVGSPASLEPLQELTLNILRDESIIALNRPLLTGERTSESYESALQACIASSRSIIKALARHAGRTPLVWPSFTWAAWMSGFIVLYAVVEGELALSVALSCVILPRWKSRRN